jgi:DNA anti-recombination protein RmuC
MPTRRKSRKTRAGKGLQPLRQTLRRLERERSRLVARARTEAARYLTTSQQRALGGLMQQARRLRTDIERRVQRGRRAFEARAEKLLSRVEHRAARALSATMKRLDLPTRADLRGIEERLARLEAKKAGAEPPSRVQETLRL